jgi:hypothetical protein
MATMLLSRQSTAALRASRAAVPARSLRPLVVRASAEPPSTETPAAAPTTSTPVEPTPVAPVSPKALSLGGEHWGRDSELQIQQPT